MRRRSGGGLVGVVAVGLISAAAIFVTGARSRANGTAAPDPLVLRGRALVINHACGDCHGGGDDPSNPGWLAGSKGPEMNFKAGLPPCGVDPKATGCFTTRPRNLTPDPTGMGRFTERQLFNALRYGLRPEDTPDVDITSTTPGKGNFPEHPHYLAPPMPWIAWRHMSDNELHAITAYLKRGLKPVENKVPDSEGPPDFWASLYVPQNIGVHPAAPFPTTNEVEPAANLRARVLRGRALVLNHGCGDCHGTLTGPAAPGWLVGATSPMGEFVLGGCFFDASQPCFHGRPKNLTPDPKSGIGRFTDRQLFNALRHGLRPEDTPDVEITSNTPGQGNFPAEPHYLGPFMPWGAFRNMSDAELREIIAYLRHGVKPVSNTVQASDDMPDHWASFLPQLGRYPVPPFPTANEVGGGGR